MEKRQSSPFSLIMDMVIEEEEDSSLVEPLWYSKSNYSKSMDSLQLLSLRSQSRKRKKRFKLNQKPNKNQWNKKNQRFKNKSSLNKKRKYLLNKLLLVKTRRKKRLQKFKRHKKLRLHNPVS